MYLKKLTRILFFILLSWSFDVPATMTFTETFSTALEYWGVGLAGAAVGVAGCVLKCVIKCCCTRRRAKHIKKTLSEFNSTELLNGMATVAKEHLYKSSGIRAFIYTGELATDESWYIITGTEQTNFLAKTIKQSRGSLHETVQGIIIIGASFDHVLLEDHSRQSDVSTNNLTTIANKCITERIPLLILYLGQDKQNKLYHPAFSLSVLTIPSTQALFDDPSARLREHHSLSVMDLLKNFSPAIAAKAIQISQHRPGTDKYPSESVCKHEIDRFVKSLRNYASADDSVTISIGESKSA